MSSKQPSGNCFTSSLDFFKKQEKGGHKITDDVGKSPNYKKDFARKRSEIEAPPGKVGEMMKAFGSDSAPSSASSMASNARTPRTPRKHCDHEKGKMDSKLNETVNNLREKKHEENGQTNCNGKASSSKSSNTDKNNNEDSVSHATNNIENKNTNAKTSESNKNDTHQGLESKEDSETPIVNEADRESSDEEEDGPPSGEERGGLPGLPGGIDLSHLQNMAQQQSSSDDEDQSIGDNDQDEGPPGCEGVDLSHLQTMSQQESDSDLSEDDMPPIRPQARGRRTAVAAESYDPDASDDEDDVVCIDKTEDQLECLREAANGIVFFKKCDFDQLDQLFKAMFEKVCVPGNVIIKQGDDGDNFYIIESGAYDISILMPDGEDKVVATLKDKGFFGELALLYNCPRNATITAATDGVLWGLDQKTFRRVIVTATAKKRKVFEDLLMSVSMLESLSPNELISLTDALETCNFNNGDCIIAEGADADDMYFIMEGECKVTVYDVVTKEQKEVAMLSRGRFFGEMALVLKQPRNASIWAATEHVKCAKLNINAFERLLGPCVDIMKRNFEFYENERKRLGIVSVQDEEPVTR